jgi:hypothetical protein
MSYDTPPPPPTGGSPYGGPPPAGAKSSRAVWSLVLGIVGLITSCLCGLGALLGIAAIVVGWPIKDQPESRTMALIGIITGVISVAFLVIGIVLYASGATQYPRG